VLFCRADEGLYGFCWGGKQAVKATKYVDAAAVFHPAFLEESDADLINIPFCLIDSKDEPKETMDKIYEALQEKPFGDKCFRKRYDIFHGFCAGRANYADEKNGKLAREVSSRESPLII
jgi:dienelactone hydrolase